VYYDLIGFETGLTETDRLEFSPIRPSAHLGGQWQAERIGILHSVTDHGNRRFEMGLWNLEHQFIVDLQDHLHRQILGSNSGIDVDHG